MPYLPSPATASPFRSGFNPGATVNGSNDPAGMLPWQQAIINAPGNSKPIPSPAAAPLEWPTPEQLPDGTSLGEQNPLTLPPHPFPPKPTGPPPWTPTPPDAPLGYTPPWLSGQQANNPPPTPPAGDALLFPPEQFAQMMGNAGLTMGPGGGWVPNPNVNGLNTQGIGGTPWVPTLGGSLPNVGGASGGYTPPPAWTYTGWGQNVFPSGPNAPAAGSLLNTVAAQPGSGYSTTAPGSVSGSSGGANAQGIWNPPGSNAAPATTTPGGLAGTAGGAAASGFTPGGPFARSSSSLGSRLLAPSLRNNGALGGGRMV